jgi:hypothetical protein
LVFATRFLRPLMPRQPVLGGAGEVETGRKAGITGNLGDIHRSAIEAGVAVHIARFAGEDNPPAEAYVPRKARRETDAPSGVPIASPYASGQWCGWSKVLQ